MGRLARTTREEARKERHGKEFLNCKVLAVKAMSLSANDENAVIVRKQKILLNNLYSELPIS